MVMVYINASPDVVISTNTQKSACKRDGGWSKLKAIPRTCRVPHWPTCPPTCWRGWWSHPPRTPGPSYPASAEDRSAELPPRLSRLTLEWDQLKTALLYTLKLNWDFLNYETKTAIYNGFSSVTLAWKHVSPSHLESPPKCLPGWPQGPVIVRHALLISRLAIRVLFILC